MRIRRATRRDIDVLVAQRRGMFAAMRRYTPEAHAIGDRAYRRWLIPRLRSGRFVAWLAVTRAGRAVAGGAVWLREEQPRPGVPAGLVPYLMSMYTESEYRGRGLAMGIVEVAARWARRRGFTWMLLHASREGARLYRRLGWKPRPEMWLGLNAEPRGAPREARPWRVGLSRRIPYR